MLDITGQRDARVFEKDNQQAAMRFAEYDANGDECLDFEEFLALQPKSVRTKYSSDEIKAWFDAADKNGSGDLSANEFFHWSMSNAAQKHGSASLEQVFRKFDTDGTGELDAIEFNKAATAMGFGAAAYDLFKDLDEDGSGTVSYMELMANLTHQAPVSVTTNKMLTSMMWCYDAGVKEEVKTIDTSRWAFRGRDVPTVRTELQRLLNQSGYHVSDLLKIFNLDLDGMPRIDDMQFCRTMRKIGYNGTQQVLDDVFKSMDMDGNNFVTFHEFYEFVRGKRHSLDPRTRMDRLLQGGMHLEPPEGIGLDSIAWDVEVLRVLLKEMIERCRISPPELMLAWTKGRRVRHSFAASKPHSLPAATSRVRVSGGFATVLAGNVAAERSGKRGLNRNDFVNTIFNQFFAVDDAVMADLWTNQVMSVTDEAFSTMLGLVRGENFFMEIGILHFDRFLGARSPPVPTDYQFPLKTKAQLCLQQARRELGMAIASQMAKREDEQIARQEHLDQMGTGGRRRDRQATPLVRAPRPRTARHKINLVRLAALSAPRNPKPLPKEEPFPFPMVHGSQKALNLERIASAPAVALRARLAEGEPLMWSLGPSPNEPLTAENATSQAPLTKVTAASSTSGSPPRSRSPEDLRRVVYTRGLLPPAARPTTSVPNIRRHPPPASHWPAVRYK